MTKNFKRERLVTRKKRIRAKVSGTAARPRMSVYRSNRFVYVQLIDDESGKTILSVNTGGLSEAKSKGKKGVELAAILGEEIAGQAGKKKIKSVVFDRGGYKYHGKIKSLAEGARKGGLEF